MRFSRHERRALAQLAADLADCPDDLALRLLPTPWHRVEAWMLAFSGFVPCGALAYSEVHAAALAVGDAASARAAATPSTTI